MRSRWLGPLALAVGLAATGAVGVGSGALPRLQAALQDGAASARELGSGRSLRLLRRLRVVHPQPLAAPVPSGDDACGELQYGLDALPPERLPSSVALPSGWWARELPVLSIAIEPCRHERLLRNPRGRGRAFEEFATVSYFEGGALRFASGTGLRLHGGWSRRLPRKSFRLHFRERYGEPGFPAGVLGREGAIPLERLVVHSDLRVDRDRRPWQFTNSLAYDIARRVGALAPRTRPVWLVLNGEPQQVYVLTEYVGDDFLRHHFGHARFAVLRGRRQREPALRRIYARERRWALRQRPLEVRDVEERVDLASLTRWYVAVLFCGTDDAFQSPLVRSERAGDDRRWRWISWDMDLSFRVPKGPLAHGWQKDLFRFVERGGSPRDHIARALLLRLTRESPAYRARLAGRVQEALNHQLTEAWLAERIAHYERIAGRYRLPFRDFLDELRVYFRERPAELRRQMQRHLGFGPERAVRVASPGPGWLAVDGYPVGPAWRGTYLEGTTVSVRVREPRRAAFSHWRIDGRDHPDPSPSLALRVAGELSVEAVARGPAPRARAPTPP